MDLAPYLARAVAGAEVVSLHRLQPVVLAVDHVVAVAVLVSTAVPVALAFAITLTSRMERDYSTSSDLVASRKIHMLTVVERRGGLVMPLSNVVMEFYRAADAKDKNLNRNVILDL
jgi:hypothetical protein